jgi:DNA invertase Pin-like site-specific DNA recombinase
MIAVLGGLADVERDLIRTRTAEGRSRAQKRGQRIMGRPPKLTDAQQAEARRRRGGGCYACRTRAQLPRRQEHDFTADSLTTTKALICGMMGVRRSENHNEEFCSG